MTTPPATATVDHAQGDRHPWPPRVALRVLLLIVFFAAAVTVYAVSIPGYYFGLFVTLLMLWPALGVAWLIAAVSRLWTADFRRPRVNGYLLAMAGIVAITATVVGMGVPEQVRYAASRPAMDAFVSELGAVGPHETARWIGWYDAERIERFQGGFRFLIRESGSINSIGFAYSPDREPPNLGGEDRYQRFDGPWWIWVETF